MSSALKDISSVCGGQDGPILEQLIEAMIKISKSANELVNHKVDHLEKPGSLKTPCKRGRDLLS